MAKTAATRSGETRPTRGCTVSTSRLLGGWRFLKNLARLNHTGFHSGSCAALSYTGWNSNVAHVAQNTSKRGSIDEVARPTATAYEKVTQNAGILTGATTISSVDLA
jgi:hypothetical protein